MRFSVLLPTRNRLELLKYAIESVKRQDYDDWEVVVADNASTDDVVGYVAGLSDARIRCFRSSTFLPVTENWNRALDNSRGDYIVMLGDDDCLLQGYFAGASQLIDLHARPEALYIEAIQFAYPGVMPGHPRGFVQRSYSELLAGRSEPFLIARATARAVVQKSMDLRFAFSYNMQHSLVSRKLVDRLRPHGKFFQGPFPDYYASNVILLEAAEVLAVPQPLVVIGITPRSFGYYYFNDRGVEGMLELDAGLRSTIPDEVRARLLPGDPLLSAWYASMAVIKGEFGRKHGLSLGTKRYRQLQADFALERTGFRAVRSLWALLTWSERARVVARWAVVRPLRRLVPTGPRRWFGRWLRAARRVGDSPWPSFDPQLESVDHKTILDLFDANAVARGEDLIDRR